MWRGAVLVAVALALSPAPAAGCYGCLVDVGASLRLCWGHMVPRYNIRNVDACFRTIERLFNTNAEVIAAGRVGEGYDVQLKQLLEEQILPIVEEFDKTLHDDTVYEERLQGAADSFIAAASKLPRASGCVPPCGFQSGAVYNCITCQYDSCEFPLDCPVKTLNVSEFSSTSMRCDVPFPLPGNTELIWKYAAQVKTQQVGEFEEVTAGAEPLYSIPSVRRWHQGTYQCEVYAAPHALARLYFYLAVTPHLVVGHTELQEVFDRALLPGGRMAAVSEGSPHLHLLLLHLLPPPAVLLTCLTAVLLLLFLSLGVLYWCSVPLRVDEGDAAGGDGRPGETHVL